MCQNCTCTSTSPNSVLTEIGICDECGGVIIRNCNQKSKVSILMYRPTPTLESLIGIIFEVQRDESKQNLSGKFYFLFLKPLHTVGKVSVKALQESTDM